MDPDHFSNLSFPNLRRLHMKFEQHWPRGFRKFSTFFPYKCMVPIQMYREANLTSPSKGQTSMYNNYFRNFGRPLVRDDLCKDTTPRHPRFWRRRFFKGFYHIWAWRPSWSTDRNHFSNLSFPQPKEAPHEIWATLAQWLQRRSRLKMLTDGRTHGRTKSDHNSSSWA